MNRRELIQSAGLATAGIFAHNLLNAIGVNIAENKTGKGKTILLVSLAGCEYRRYCTHARHVAYFGNFPARSQNYPLEKKQRHRRSQNIVGKQLPKSESYLRKGGCRLQC